ncbi:hypothetical protein GOODEAATRI_018910 [Goodea atripinnis]|uniref:Growth hormone receptor n=1 Tax=Goodea atripinnis TaxID=208336 RepID=A0ABV0PPU1_9TELE
METFHCRWSVGSFQNLSEPRGLRLFYFNRLPLTTSETNWSECPLYSTERPDECFFNENHTTIWTSYNVQLRSRDQSVLYDEISFSVPDIGEFTASKPQSGCSAPVYFVCLFLTPLE